MSLNLAIICLHYGLSTVAVKFDQNITICNQDNEFENIVSTESILL